MRLFRYSLMALAAASAGSVHAAPVRYKDNLFANVTVASGIAYGANKDYTGAQQTFLMDVYQPQGDTAKARPLMIFIHGGGFSSGDRTEGDIVTLCRAFAMKGYVTASFDYRLQPGLNTAQAMGIETFRAVQDGKAAVRFLRAHKADYRIDDSRILIGGTSAGGALALQYAYLDASELKPYIDTNSLGGMEGGSGTPGVSSAVNGVFNGWGCVGDSTILYNAKLPVISFHGTIDSTVPIDVGYALGNPALVSFGSACIHRVLTRIGKVHSVFKPFVGMGHGWPGGARGDTIISMTADFAYDVLFPTTVSLVPARPKGSAAKLPTRNDLFGSGLRLFSADGRERGKPAGYLRALFIERP